MKSDIECLSVFSPIIIGDWMFRCSISNKRNIMIIAFCKSIEKKHTLLVRFFTDSTAANTWVDECCAGKCV